MPLTAGEFIAGGSLGAAFIAIGGWIKSVAGRCCGLDKRIKDLENTVAIKSSLVDVHENNLCAGEKKMTEMKLELAALNKGLSDLHQQGHDTANTMEKAVLRLEPQIKALGEKIKTGINEVFLKLDPRLKNVERQVEELEENKD